MVLQKSKPPSSPGGPPCSATLPAKPLTPTSSQRTVSPSQCRRQHPPLQPNPCGTPAGPHYRQPPAPIDLETGQSAIAHLETGQYKNRPKNQSLLQLKRCGRKKKMDINTLGVSSCQDNSTYDFSLVWF